MPPRVTGWCHLLGGVLKFRTVSIAHAAPGHGVVPHPVRLPGERQTLVALHSPLEPMSSTRRAGVMHVVLKVIARHRVGTRLERSEP